MRHLSKTITVRLDQGHIDKLNQIVEELNKDTGWHRGNWRSPKDKSDAVRAAIMSYMISSKTDVIHSIGGKTRSGSAARKTKNQVSRKTAGQ